MKKLLIIVFIIAVVPSAKAQLLRSIARSAANQAANSAENRAEKEVDKQVDKSVNKFFDNMMKEDTTQKAKETTSQTKSDQSQGSASMSSFMSALGVSNEAIPHKSDYKFTGQIIMTFEATDEKGQKMTASEYTTCFNEKSSDAMFKMKGDDNSTVSTIIDQENTCMLVLTESSGSKTGFATRFDAETSNNVQTQGETTAEEESPTSPDADECVPTKTGNKKTISGFSCTEYACENDEVSISIWVTKDFSANNNKLFKKNAMGMNYKTDGFDGMVMQYETHSKKDKSSSLMTVKSIDMNKSSSFSTAGYQISSFNFNAKN